MSVLGPGGITYRLGEVIGKDETAKPVITWRVYGEHDDPLDPASPVRQFAACYVGGDLLAQGSDGWCYSDTSKPERVVRRLVNDKTLARARACMPDGWPLLSNQEGLVEQKATPSEPHPHQLLDDLAAFAGRYVIFPSDHALVAVVLWVAHSHVVEAFESSPRLALISPEKQSGKTRCLEVLELVCPNAMQSFNLTPAAIFRAIAHDRPTLLFDEVDTIFGSKAAQHEELRGLLNAGHRNGQKAYRCVGDPKNMKVEAFPAYCAVALAGIGDLPDTIIDRSIVVKMRRRAPGEKVTSFRARLASAEAAPLAKRLSAWAACAAGDLGTAWPEMPEGLVDRPADVWAPLLAIADLAGGEWPRRAREAALKLNAERQRADTSLGVRLLGDLRHLFELYRQDDVDQLPSEQILRYLNGLDEAPWGNLRGKPLDARGLARRLRRYDVGPTSVRVGDKVFRGYRRPDLHDAFARYLPPYVPLPAGEALQALQALHAQAAHVADAADVAGSGGRKALHLFGEGGQPGSL